MTKSGTSMFVVTSRTGVGRLEAYEVAAGDPVVIQRWQRAGDAGAMTASKLNRVDD